MMPTVRLVVMLVTVGISLAGSPAVGRAQGRPELQRAQTQFAETNYENARETLNSLIANPPPGLPPAELRAVITAARELRGRVLFEMRLLAEAEADFQELLFRNPNHSLVPEASTPAKNAFDAVRGRFVGTVVVSVTPADAIVTIDGAPLVQPREASMRLFVGPHTISASRVDHEVVNQSFNVSSGPNPPFRLDLQRIASTVEVTTSVADVEVIIDGLSRGKTEPTTAAGVSGPGRKTVSGLANGQHWIEYRRDCFTGPARTSFDTLQPLGDYKQTATLTEATAVLNVTLAKGDTVEASIFDGVKVVEKAPAALTLCQGAHTIEVRSRWGRDIRRLELKAGQREDFQARLRPAFALVSDSGANEGIQGGPNYRLEAETAFRDTETVAVFHADGKSIIDRLATQLPVDWLAFSNVRRALGGAANVGDDLRRRIGTEISSSLEMQGVAAVAIDPAGDRASGDMLLMLLAPGSAFPDVIRWRRDAPGIRQAVQQLSAAPSPFRMSIGLVAVDVRDLGTVGAVVSEVETGGTAAAAGIRVGDVITHVGSTAIDTAGRLFAMVGASESNQVLSLGIVGPAGSRRSDVTVQAVPNVVSFGDRSLLANKLAVDYTFRLQRPRGPLEELALRLNLAAVWLGLDNWAAALEDLDRIDRLRAAMTLPPSVAGRLTGTMQYLRGLHAAGIREYAKAEEFYNQAEKVDGPFLSEAGQPISEMARQSRSQLSASRAGGR